MRTFLTRLYYSFPVQLLILHLKHGKSLLLFWLLLFAFITYQLGAGFGGAFLFLDPEYVDRVSFWSFWWVGLCFAFFLTAWYIATYMTNAFRFPFLATLRHPFFHFCLNNSLIPLGFLVTYFISIGRFQAQSEFRPEQLVFEYIGGFVVGFLCLFLAAAFYFTQTNKNVLNYLEKIQQKDQQQFKKQRGRRKRATDLGQLGDEFRHNVLHLWKSIEENAKIWRVDNFISEQFTIRLTRNVDHYPPELLQSVFRQNHFNAFFIQIVALLLLIGLGFLIEYPLFQIPAAGTTLLFFAVMVSFVAAITYWFREWRMVVLLALLLLLNFSTRFDWATYETPAYGLDYDQPPVPYNLANLRKVHTPDQARADHEKMTETLENWKRKAQAAQGLSENEKPVMLLLNISGGGAASTVWCMAVTAELDSLLNHRFFDHAALITGASGGMIAATYLRELYLRRQTNSTVSLQNPYYLHRISKDYLNPIALSLATNDIFYPFQRVEVGGYWYRKNRAYSFEHRFHQNTNSMLLGKNFSDYAPLEQQARVPMIIYTPATLNDARRVYISSQPVSFLCQPFYTGNDTSELAAYFEPDGIDFGLFFKQHDSYNLPISTAMRLSATYPFVMPNAVLPSSPPMQLVDAGITDNYGFATTVHFIQAFRDWLNNNVARVVVVRISVSQKIAQDNEYIPPTLLDKALQPFSVLLGNDAQEFALDQWLLAANDWLNGRLSVVNLEYVPSKKDARASMSFHLTTREKQEILQALTNAENRRNVEKLQRLLEGR